MKHAGFLRPALSTLTLLLLAGCFDPGDLFRSPPERVLRYMARDPQSADREEVGLKKLRGMGSRAIDPIVEFYKKHNHLGDPSWWLANSVVECIAEVRERDALAKLTSLAKEDDRTLALCAIYGIRGMATRKDISLLIRLVEDDRFRWKDRLIELLGRLGGGEARHWLVLYATDPRGRCRRGAFLGIKALKDRSLIPGLRKAFEREKNPQLRIAAAETLASLGDTAGGAYLAAVLEGDGPWYLLVTAAYASGRVREKKAVPGLIRLLGHSELYYRDVAREALTMIGTDEALKAIVERLPKEERERASRPVEYGHAYDRDPFMDWHWYYDDEAPPVHLRSGKKP
jgi:HEAT repeat protein